MRTARAWQCGAGRARMMAVVRTSLQKVVLFLHRLQRMAITSPRYQKLCK
ncbi:utrophin isoform X4, partial [Tachysurus ichikawai]